MKKYVCTFLGLLFLSSCGEQKSKEAPTVLWTPYNDSAEVAANRNHKEKRMRFALIQSKVLDKNEVFLPLYQEVLQMTDAKYEAMRPWVLEQDIPTIQRHITSGKFSYEDLVLFFLRRIYRYELNNATTLNTIITLNTNVVAEARELDKLSVSNPSQHPIYGMPILLKDNINTANMPTTAGAMALLENETDDAFIVTRLKEHGALILGKVNLSEWAYYLCEGCPLGYSAVGGQTLNPYGRGIFETGGSSSGSGTAVAANYAVAAVGTETSGSILSPSSQNSVVGLKPTVGLLSRTGIVPISSTLDTPGPMTKTIADNAILLSAMLGKDREDAKSVEGGVGIPAAYRHPKPIDSLRLGAMKSLMDEDSLYRKTIDRLRKLGATIVSFDPPEIQLEGFLTVLNIDMRNDLPKYLSTQVKNKDAVRLKGIADVVDFNAADSAIRIPYGQALFEGILIDTTSQDELAEIKDRLERDGRAFFDTPMDAHQLDAILSINNYHAGYAAMAKYPALTVPMGYTSEGEPVSLTFIGKPFAEADLLRIGKAFEGAFPIRTLPEAYSE